MYITSDLWLEKEEIKKKKQKQEKQKNKTPLKTWP